MIPAVEILLVEDSAADAEITLHALRRENLANHLYVASDGEEALNYLFRQGKFRSVGGENPRLVFLDLQLPKVDGLEVLRRIKGDERTRNVPVVVVTGSRDDAELAECRRLNVSSFVQKPVNFTQFHSAIRQAGMYWLVVSPAAPAGVLVAV